MVQAVGEQGNGFAATPLPEAGFLRAAPGKGEIAGGGHGHLDFAVGHLVVKVAAAIGVLPENGTFGKGGGDFTIGSKVPVAIQHEMQGGGIAVGHAVVLAVIAARVGDDIVICPGTILAAAGEIVVDVHNVGYPGIAELSEGFGVGVPGEGAAAFAEGRGLTVAIGVDVPDTFAGQV